MRITRVAADTSLQRAEAHPSRGVRSGAGFQIFGAARAPATPEVDLQLHALGD